PVQPLQSTAKGERQNPCRIDQQVDGTEAEPGAGVVRGLLVRAQGNLFGKGTRDLATVGEDVPAVAVRQPELEAGGGEDGGEKDGREQGFSHAGAVSGTVAASPAGRRTMTQCALYGLRQKIMAQDPNHLIWIDMEMTGLEPDTDRIIEVAIVITNSQ